MTRTAFLFPGQGSQCAEMGLDFIDHYAQARERYQEAESVLGWSVSDLSRAEGSEKLGITLYTQPALYTLSCAIADIVQAAGLEAALAAGHSAGEYAALYAAGAWDFATGLRVIAERARLMHEKAGPGAMAAVMGMAPETLKPLCEGWREGLVRVANYNSPKQIVITGEERGIDAIAPYLKEQGAKRVVKLKVSGAFHSPLMKGAQAEFDTFLKDISIQAPRVAWISNNTAEAVADPEAIRARLVKQFCEPVQWIDTMALVERECEKALEVGPGTVLKGMTKACCDKLECETTATVAGVRKVLESYGLSA